MSLCSQTQRQPHSHWTHKHSGHTHIPRGPTYYPERRGTSSRGGSSGLKQEEEEQEKSATLSIFSPGPSILFIGFFFLEANSCPAMRIFNLFFYLLLLLVAAVAPASSARPGKHPRTSPSGHFNRCPLKPAVQTQFERSISLRRGR